MATQTRTERQAAAKKAAATRRKNESQRHATSAKRSARRTRGTAAAASRDARSAAGQGSRAAARSGEAWLFRLESIGRQLERGLHVQVGALLEARDAVTGTVRTYSDRRRLRTRLRRFERRGETALRRTGREARRGFDRLSPTS